MRRLAAFVAVLIAATVSATSMAGATAKQTVLLFGDSLTHETAATVEAGFVGNPSYTVSVHGQTGHAPCDFIAGVRTALSRTRTHYALFALETAGNSQTPCMREPGQCARCYMPIGSPEYVARYRSDLDTIASMAESAGVPMLFISPPPFSDAISQLNVVYDTIEPQLVADHPEVTTTDQPREAVSKPDGSFAATLPCLASETAADGCNDGRIPVRAPDGVHFCPTGFAGTCPEYSSGAVRFGTAELAVLP